MSLVVYLKALKEFGSSIKGVPPSICAGDFFHAAPNIDHSQKFVRKDIIEWMKWLRTDFGFDGWRLDFARYRHLLQ